MHFSKTYAQLLLTLPPELQQNAIEYRQLKKLINKVVLELTSLGLSPSVLHSLLQPKDSENSSGTKGKQRAAGERPLESSDTDDSTLSLPAEAEMRRSAESPQPKAVYELVHDGDSLEPRLRLWVAETRDHFDEEPITTDEDDSDSRVAIYLEKPDSTPSSPVVDKSAGGLGRSNSHEDLLLVSKPVSAKPGQSLVWSLQKMPKGGLEPDDPEAAWRSPSPQNEFEDIRSSVTIHPVELVKKQVRVSEDGTRELVIPLQSDTAFFQLLYTALQSLAAHLLVIRSNFIKDLEDLARTISHTARPRSSTSRGFVPSSSLGDPQSISAPLISPFSTSFIPGGKNKNDLYAWREIFQLYIESAVFEGMTERERGERDLVETEKRLALFAERVTGRGLSDSRQLKLKESRVALERFLTLNVLILNLKKFQFANAEATRKILKKHAKRTALPIPAPALDVSPAVVSSHSQLVHYTSVQGSTGSHPDFLSLIPTTATSFPHMLVQAIGEILLPIIPHIDDYSCVICTNIAFKPIRLACGHLFCVRCLVKMQKRGQDHCPCCRAPTVLKADRSNVDWALLNFMQDWFPQESALKLKQNEREAAKEELEEMGITDQGCYVM